MNDCIVGVCYLFADWLKAVTAGLFLFGMSSLSLGEFDWLRVYPPVLKIFVGTFSGPLNCLSCWFFSVFGWEVGLVSGPVGVLEENMSWFWGSEYKK